VYDAVVRSARDDLRSVTAQVEMLLRRALTDHRSRSAVPGNVLPLVAAAERAERAAANTSAGYRGVLRVAAVTSAFDRVLPDILERFRRERPLVDLQVEEVDSQAGVDALLRTEVDVAIIRQPTGDRRLSVWPLRHDEYVAAIPAMPLDRWVVPTDPQGPIDLASLRDAPWVWIPRRLSPAYHDEIVAACQQAGFSPDARHRALSIRSQLSMVASGLGVALVPRTSAGEHPQVAYLGLRKPVRLTELSLVMRGGVQEPLVVKFAESTGTFEPGEPLEHRHGRAPGGTQPGRGQHPDGEQNGIHRPKPGGHGPASCGAPIAVNSPGSTSSRRVFTGRPCIRDTSTYPTAANTSSTRTMVMIMIRSLRPDRY
jgi:DNA-binding transcriptional LysR family regulator